MANIQQFEQIISQLLSSDNAQRGQAEQAFNELKKSPDAFVMAMLQLIGQSSNEQGRALACVLLRRALGKSAESLWPAFSQQSQQMVKQTLLQLLENEGDANVRTKIGDCIAELATSIVESGEWNELLPFLFKLTQSQNDAHREVALDIFSDLAVDLGDVLKPHFEVLRNVFLNGLNDPKSVKVRVAALTATANFLQVLEDANERIQFQQLIPSMLGCISAALNSSQEDDARAALELFVDLAELDAVFLRPQLGNIVTAMLQIATAQGLEDSTKHLAVEFMVTLAENRPGMTRRQPKYIENLVPIILNLMLDLDDDEEWNLGEEEDEVDVTNAAIGEESFDRLALAVGGKTLIPVLYQHLPALFGHQDWKHRHTALMALSIVGEGCRATMEPNMADIIKSILPFFSDPHPRVRWAAANTVGQMSTDFGPEFQANFHSLVLPALAGLMDDADNPRVQSHAASAVINFCEHATAEILAPYSETLMIKLLLLLQGGKTIAQEQAVTAIAAIADCIKTDFVKYYPTVMPWLKSIMSNAQTKEFRTLRGKAMECITLLSVAVGKETFAPDAKEVLDMLLATQRAKLESDDPQISFLLQAWARLCKCLGQDFVPYLSYVMPPLLRSAKISPDVTVTDADAEDVDGWEFIPVGDKHIGINTSALEEKATACNMLYCYVSELAEGFFPYVDEVAKVLVPLIRFYYHDGVRSAAVSSLPHLLHSAATYLKQAGGASGADTTYVRNLWNFIFPTLIEGMKEEVDLETLVLELEILTECMDEVGENCLSPEQLARVADTFKHLISQVQSRRAERSERKREEDFDDEEGEKIAEEDERDEEIIGGIAEFVGHASKWHKQTFFPFFDMLRAEITKFAAPESMPSDRQAALCILDDMIDNLGAAALSYVQHFLPSMMAYIGDGDPTVRQAAVYGMGSVAQHGGDQVAPIIPEILSRLTTIIQLPDSRDEVNAMATENAISSVGRICLFQSKAIDFPQVYNLWLSWLPVTVDNVESKVVYSTLCSLIESNNPHVMGQGFENLPKVLHIFASVLGTDLIDEALTQRIVNILKQARSAVPSDVLQRAWGSIPPAEQATLQQYA